MNSRHAHYILTVLEEGSISNAAKKLYISQPSLSQMIQAIEQNLKVKIFNRHTSPISLTFAGTKYVEAARKILTINRNLTTALNEIKDETHGIIRVGISIHRSMYLLPKILPIFTEKYPDVELQLIEDSSNKIEELARNEEIDLAFVNPEQQLEELEYILLQQERMVLFASMDTELAKNRAPESEIFITDAGHEKFIALHRGQGARVIQDKMFHEAGISPKIIVETKSVEVARRLAIACKAVTIYPETMLNKLENFNSCSTYFPIIGEQFKRNFYLCYNRDLYLSRFMQEFISMAQAASQ